MDAAAPFLIPSSKPQLHSSKCHHTYNATRSLPVAIWIRSLRFDVDRSSRQSHRYSSNASDDGSDDDDDEQAILAGIPFFSDSTTVLYEIVLYYEHNRACTIYRTPEDFAKLKESAAGAKYFRRQQQCHPAMMMMQQHHGLAKLSSSSFTKSPVEDVDDLQRFLSKTISRKGRDCPALEYFLRRRINDCGGQ